MVNNPFRVLSTKMMKDNSLLNQEKLASRWIGRLKMMSPYATSIWSVMLANMQYIIYKDNLSQKGPSH